VLCTGDPAAENGTGQVAYALRLLEERGIAVPGRAS
jgi:hypothetical protein